MGKRVLAAVAALGLGTVGALAADLPARRAPPAYAPAPVFVWSGCYFGGLTGYAFSDRQTVRTTGTTPGGAAAIAAGIRPAGQSVPHDGLTSIGGGLGCDYQFNPGNGIVAGIAADGTWMDLVRRRSSIGPGPAFADSNFRQSFDTLGTVRGRIGYAFDRFLVYGTGGFAFGNVEYRSTFFAGARNASPVVAAGVFDGIETGYVYGGGVEYAIPTDSFLSNFNLLKYVGITTDAVTVKVEYLRYDLGSRTVAVSPTVAGAPGFASRFTTEGSLVRGGFAYRFGL